MNDSLGKIVKGRTVFVGVGNELRSDDAIGLAIIERIRHMIDCPCINAGQVPENSFGLIVKEQPDTVVIIDAVQLFMKPGSYQLLTETDIQHTGFSTHTLSLSVFMQYLKEASEAEVYLLGVQPRSTDLGQGLTPQLEESLEEIVDLIVDVCGHSLFLYPNEEETDNV
jgi:hydrogenase maturation protease HycI